MICRANPSGTVSRNGFQKIPLKTKQKVKGSKLFSNLIKPGGNSNFLTLYENIGLQAVDLDADCSPSVVLMKPEANNSGVDFAGNVVRAMPRTMKLGGDP